MEGMDLTDTAQDPKLGNDNNRDVSSNHTGQHICYNQRDSHSSTVPPPVKL